MSDASADIQIIKDAVLIAGAQTRADDGAPPLGENHVLTEIGVRAADGAVPENGLCIYRHRTPYPAPLAGLRGPMAHIAGQAFFGGIIGAQFGHLVTQSLGRLWAAPPDIPILFLNDTVGLTAVPEYFITLIRLLGVNNPVQLVTAPTRVDELILANDHCNLERRPSVTPQFSDWLEQRAPTTLIDDDLSIYVSRSQLGPFHSQFLQETVLETALRGQGYQIIYPEQLSIAQQLDIYSRARRLIFADGSAIHLWSLIARAPQHCAMIWRRPVNRNLLKWFHGLDRANPVMLDCRFADFVGTDRTAKGGAAVLDIPGLWVKLRKRGFHRSREVVGISRAELDPWLASLHGWADPEVSPPFELDPVSTAVLALRRRLVMRD